MAFLWDTYQRTPALVIALSVLILVPLAAALATAFRRASRARTCAVAQDPARPASQRIPISSRTDESTAPAFVHQARLAVPGVDNGSVLLARPLIRIGRNKDNDICLPDRSVHRYHAVIERSSDAIFVITDLSGTQGNGVRINGERMAKAQLKHGDIIELGRAALKFENAPM